MIKYTEVVKEAQTVKLVSVSKDQAICMITHAHKIYTFPVPLSDIGEGKLLAIDKPILYARWIRQAIDNSTFKLFLNGDQATVNVQGD